VVFEAVPRIARADGFGAPDCLAQGLDDRRRLEIGDERLLADDWHILDQLGGGWACQRHAAHDA